MKNNFIEVQKHQELRGRAWINKDYITYIYAREGDERQDPYKVVAHLHGNSFKGKWEFKSQKDYEKLLTSLIPDYK
jgi:hypothetical protein